MRGTLALWSLGLVACSFEAPTGNLAAEQPDARLPTQPDAPPAPDAPGEVECTTCPPNDRPEGAIAITAPGRITAILTDARDDAAPSCGGAGGRDLFYELVVPTRQVVYLDTVDSDFDAVLAVRPGSCTQTQAQLACANDPCTGSTHAQLARSLAAGTYCVIVDEGAASAGGSLALDVTFAGRDGIELTGTPPYQISGDSCTGTDLRDPSCEFNADDPGTAKDLMYWFAVCPGSHNLRASTCGAGYDSIVSIAAESGELVCRDQGCVSGNGSQAQVGATGNGLVMVVVDGWDGDCGTFTLTVTP